MTTAKKDDVKPVVKVNDPGLKAPPQPATKASHRFRMNRVGGREIRLPSGACVTFPVSKRPNGSREYVSFFETEDSDVAAELVKFAEASPAWAIEKL